MLIINPIVTASNSDSFLDEDGDTLGYTRLMEFRSNDQLNRLLSGHQLSFRLKSYDLESPIADGDFVFSEKNGITVLSVGVSEALTGSDVKDIVERIKSAASSEDMLFSEDTKEVPGSSLLLDRLSEEGVAQGFGWGELRKKIIAAHSSAVEKDHRKEITP